MVTAADSAFVYTDLHGLAGLRREARQNSPGAIREAAKQFEAVFVQMMLKSMRAASPSDGGGIMDSDQSRLYRDMYDQQIALSMAQQGKLGLADTIARQLGGEGAGTPSRPVSPEMVGDPLATLRQVQRIRSSVAMPAETATVKTGAIESERNRYPVSDAPFEPSSPAAFVRRMWPHAQEAARRLGEAPAAIAEENETGKQQPPGGTGRKSGDHRQLLDGRHCARHPSQRQGGRPHVTAAISICQPAPAWHTATCFRTTPGAPSHTRKTR